MRRRNLTLKFVFKFPNDDKGAFIKDVPTRGGGGHHNGDIRGQREGGVKVNKDVPFKY